MKEYSKLLVFSRPNRKYKQTIKRRCLPDITTGLVGERINANTKTKEYQCDICEKWVLYEDLQRRSRKRNFVCKTCAKDIVQREKNEYVDGYEIWEAFRPLDAKTKERIFRVSWNTIRNEVQMRLDHLGGGRIDPIKKRFKYDLFHDIAYRVFPTSFQEIISKVLREPEFLSHEWRAWLGLRRGILPWYLARFSSIYFMMISCWKFSVDSDFENECRGIKCLYEKSLFGSLLRDTGGAEPKRRLHLKHIDNYVRELRMFARNWDAGSKEERDSWLALTSMAESILQDEAYGTLIGTASAVVELFRANHLPDEAAIHYIGNMITTMFEVYDRARGEKEEYIEALFLEEKTGIDYVAEGTWRRSDRERLYGSADARRTPEAVLQ